uniref:Chromosome 11 open reading frame 98 n=1 Tax=Equus caballus TaxID=9796 RepID=A0A9L0SN47_HORSE
MLCRTPPQRDLMSGAMSVPRIQTDEALGGGSGARKFNHSVLRGRPLLRLVLRSSARANITLSGKKRRKLLQQIRLAQKEKAAMEVEAPQKPARTNEPQPKSKKKTKAPQDIDMEDLEDKS